MAACRDLAKRVIDVEIAINPIAKGLSGFERDQDKSDVAAAKVALAGVETLVIGEQLILGAGIVKRWHFFSKAFNQLDYMISNKIEDCEESVYHYLLWEVTQTFVDKINEEIVNSLNAARFELLHTDIWTAAGRAGQLWLESRFEAIRKHPRKYSFEAVLKRRHLRAPDLINEFGLTGE